MKRTSVLAVTVVSILALSVPAASARTIDNASDPKISLPPGRLQVPAAIKPGDSGRWVAMLQSRLESAGFRPGDLDGTYGEATLGAVYAFQKVNNLPRDGVFLSGYWDHLSASVLLPGAQGAPDRIEVDLGKQVLFLVRAQQVETVLPVSAGNGDTYRNASGSVVRARTPEGSYTFYDHIDGWRISYLGGLYRPFYFRGGYAIHGSYSVPPYPASHGCVRVELWDMDYLTTELEVGMPVYIYGHRLTREEVVPSDVPRPGRPVIPRKLPTIA